MKQHAKYIRWLEEIKIEDIPIVGSKNASLGEMYRDLASQGVKIPNGFAVTAEEAERRTLERRDLYYP